MCFSLVLKASWPEEGLWTRLGNPTVVFLNMLELVSYYNPPLTDLIFKYKQVGWVLQTFHLLYKIHSFTLWVFYVRSEIISYVKNAKHFFSMFDCIPDISHIEQMTIILRYVNTEGNECVIEESCIEFIDQKGKMWKGTSCRNFKSTSKTWIGCKII